MTGETVEAYLARRTGVAGAQTELDAATEALSKGEPGSDDRYSDALERWLDLGAADFESRVQTVMAGPGKAVFPRWFITTIIKTFACIPFLADVLFKVLPPKVSVGIKYFKSDRPVLYRHLQASLLLLVVSFFFGQGLNFLLLWWLPTQFAQLFR